MNELQIIRMENTDITTWNFPALKAELEAYLSEYDGLVYTDETMKEAKKDRTTLKKAINVVDDARKAFRARCLMPYDALEPQIKELADLIKERHRQIDETVKGFEARQKAAREKEIREYYDSITRDLGEYAGRIYEKIFDAKWTNATTSTVKYREAVRNAVSAVRRDLESIAALRSPLEDQLREEYLKTLSMEAVLRKHDELKKLADTIIGRAAPGGTPVVREEAPVKPAFLKPVGPFEADAEPEQKADGRADAAGDDKTMEIVLRVRASRSRLDQLCDFMKATGVSWEILQ